MRVALACLLLLGALCLPVDLPAQQTDGAEPVTVAERYLLAAANQDRARLGLKALELDDALTLAARRHALLMVRYGSISHQFDGEPGLAERVAATGMQVSRVSENVAEAPDASQIHDLWMQSAGHRANLLDREVDRVGISVIAVHGQFFAVEDFGRAVLRLSLEAQEQAVAALLSRTGVTMLPTTPAARETCSLDQGYRGTTPSFVMRYTTASLSQLPAELYARLQTKHYGHAVVGACNRSNPGPLTGYALAVLLYP